MDTRPPPVGTPVLASGRPLSQDEKTWGMLAHLSGLLVSLLTAGFLSFLGPLFVLLVKGKESPWIEAQAKEALNFQITWTIAMWISWALVGCLIGIAVVPIVGIAGIVLCVLGAMKANDGIAYRYPATLRLVK